MKNNNGEISSNRKKLLNILTDFYEELYRSRRQDQISTEEALEKRVINRGLENMPTFCRFYNTYETLELDCVLKALNENRVDNFYTQFITQRI